jgi:hypothetical protein
MGYSYAEKLKNTEAGILEAFSNFKILCINQHSFSETYNGKCTLSSLADSAKKYTKPILLHNERDNSFRIDCIEKQHANRSDLYVIHPPQSFINKRHNWYANDTDRYLYKLPLKYVRDTNVTCSVFFE